MCRMHPENLQGLSREQRHVQSLNQRARAESRIDLAENSLLALVRTGIENDFETVVFPQYPLLRDIKRQLMGSSATEGTALRLYSLLRFRAQAPRCLAFTGPRRMQVPLNNGSSSRASRLSSRRPCPAHATGARCSQSDFFGPFCLYNREWLRKMIGRSINGRSGAFGALYPGSSPGRPAKTSGRQKGVSSPSRTQYTRVIFSKQAGDSGKTV